MTTQKLASKIESCLKQFNSYMPYSKIETELNDSYLELKGYMMIHTDEGSRLIERNEKPDFYDISILRYIEKTGVIDQVEEIEDEPSSKQANIIMKELEAKYGLCGEWIYNS